MGEVEIKRKNTLEKLQEGKTMQVGIIREAIRFVIGFAGQTGFRW